MRPSNLFVRQLVGFNLPRLLSLIFLLPTNVLALRLQASVNREVLLGRPFSECVKCIREASLSEQTARKRHRCEYCQIMVLISRPELHPQHLLQELTF